MLSTSCASASLLMSSRSGTAALADARCGDEFFYKNLLLAENTEELHVCSP